MADKYVNATGVQTIKTWIEGKFGLKTELDALDAKVDEIISEGGEPNVIEKVKVNGTELTPDAQKAVDVTVPTDLSDLTNTGADPFAKESDIPTKVSDLTNDGDGTTGSEFATKSYVDTNGGKIQKVKYDGTELTIDTTDKSVDIPKEVFVAEYQTTSYDDIISAMNANKAIIVENAGEFYNVVYGTPAGGRGVEVYLYSQINGGQTCFTITSPSTWTEQRDSFAYNDDIPTKVSDLTNDGDGTADSRFATEAFVEENGGKIQKVKYDGTELAIDTTDKSVNVPKEIFIAVVNTTSYADVAAAFDDNKTIRIINRSPGISVFASASKSSDNVFHFYANYKTKFYSWTLDSTNTWTMNVLDEMAVTSQIPTVVSQLTNDSGYQTASDVQSAIESGVAAAVKIKGSVANYEALPTTGNSNGDMYDTLDTGRNYVWIYDESTQTGRWDDYAGTMDLSAFWTSTTGQTNTLEAMTVAEINAILEPSA